MDETEVTGTTPKKHDKERYHYVSIESHSAYEFKINGMQFTEKHKFNFHFLQTEDHTFRGSEGSPLAAVNLLARLGYRLHSCNQLPDGNTLYVLEKCITNDNNSNK